MSPDTPVPKEKAIASFILFYAQSSIGVLSHAISVASLSNILHLVTRELRRAGKAISKESTRGVLHLIVDGADFRDLGVANIKRAKAVVTLEILNVMVAFVLGSACAFAVSTRISLVFLILYLVTTTNRIGSILPNGDADKRPLRYDDCTLVVRKSATGQNDLSVEFKTPNAKDAESRDLPVTLRRNTAHSLLCPLLWFLVLAQRADPMSHWPYDIPTLLSPVVFEKTSSEDLKFPFKGDAVCWSTRPMSVGGAAEFLHEVSQCLRLSIPVRAHNLRMSGALKLKWLGKSMWRAKWLILQAERSRKFARNCGMLGEAAHGQCTRDLSRWSTLSTCTNSCRAQDVVQAVAGSSSGVTGLFNELPSVPKAGYARRLTPAQYRDVYARPERESIIMLLATDKAVRFMHDEYQLCRQEALSTHNAENMSQLPDGVKHALRRQFNIYTTEVRRHAVQELHDLDGQQDGHDAVMNVADLDLDQLDYDADALREIDTTFDRSTAAADLAAALNAGHITIDEYAEQVADMDEVVIDPVLLNEDEDDDDEDAAVASSDEAEEQSADDESSDSDAGPGSDYVPESDEEPDGDDEPLVNADSDADANNAVTSAGTSSRTDVTTSPPTEPFMPKDADFFPTSAGPFPELHDLLKRDSNPDFLALFTALTDTPPDDMKLGFRAGHRPTVSGACPVCRIDLRTAIPPRSSRPSVYVPNWAAHVVKCSVEDAINKWEASSRHLYPNPETFDRNPLTGRPPQKDGFAPNKLYNGLRARIGTTCATCRQDPDTTAEQKAEFGSIGQVMEHLAEYHHLLVSKTVEPSVPASAEFFTNLGRYVVDPIEKINQSRALVEERILKSTAAVDAYGVDPAMTIPAGELPDDAAVQAPSDHKYRQVTGPLHSTARDGICFLCSNDPDKAWVDRGKPYNSKDQALETHHDDCFRARIKALHPLIFKERISNSDSDSVDNSDHGPGSDDALSHHSIDSGAGDQGVRADGVWVCPDQVCSANDRQFATARHFINHAVAVHHVRIKSGKGYTGAKRNSKAHSTTAKPLHLFQVGFGSDATFEHWVAKNRSPTVKARGGKASGKTKAKTSASKTSASKTSKDSGSKDKGKGKAKA